MIDPFKTDSVHQLPLRARSVKVSIMEKEDFVATGNLFADF